METVSPALRSVCRGGMALYVLNINATKTLFKPVEEPGHATQALGVALAKYRV